MHTNIMTVHNEPSSHSQQMAVSTLMQHSQMKTCFIDQWSQSNQQLGRFGSENKCEVVDLTDKLDDKPNNSSNTPNFYALIKIEDSQIKKRYKNQHSHPLSSNRKSPYNHHSASLLKAHQYSHQNKSPIKNHHNIHKSTVKKRYSELQYEQKLRKMSLPWIKRIPKFSETKQQKSFRHQLQKSVQLMKSKKKLKITEKQQPVMDNVSNSHQQPDGQPFSLQILKQWVSLNKPGDRPKLATILKEKFESKLLKNKRNRRKTLIAGLVSKHKNN